MSDALLTIIKLVLAVLLLPVVWACGTTFYGHVVASFPGAYGEFFLWGMFGFLVLFLFFYQFWGVYELGQKIISSLFYFASPAHRFIAHVVPFYLTVILLLFYVTTNFLGVDSYDYYFMFFAGFTLVMHVLLTAQDLQEQEKAFIKPAYLCVMTLAFTLTIFVTVLLFDLVFGEFTFPAFFQSVAFNARDIYFIVGERILFLK